MVDQFANRVVLKVSPTAPTGPTSRAAIHTLEELGIVDELTGQRRRRVFAYRQYLDILSEGAQPL